MIFSNNTKGIQCRECEGFKHIQSKYANTHKKKNKALKSTWSDDESEGSQEDNELVNNQVAFSGSLVSNNFVFIQGRAGVATESVCWEITMINQFIQGTLKNKLLSPKLI